MFAGSYGNFRFLPKCRTIIKITGSSHRRSACSLRIRIVSASQYQSLICELSLSPPATLCAEYLNADAARDSRLQPWFIVVDSESGTWMHDVHVTDIPGTPWRDASSPYGYGGPLSTCEQADFLSQCWNTYAKFMFEQRIVAEYIRFHPLLRNDRFYGGQISDNREVVVLDLKVADFDARYVPRVRSLLRRVDRQAICYLEADLAANAQRFVDFHWAAMKAIGADGFYLFSIEYFSALAATGLARLGVCVRESDAGIHGSWLAAAIFLESGETAEYHLAANSADGRTVGASSFLIDQAARLAQQRGRKYLYLGGGSDRSPQNPLLFFKAGFSPTRLMYRTGSTVFNAVGRDEVKHAYPLEWSAYPDRPIFHRKV
jgi:hypothetical protein